MKILLTTLHAKYSHASLALPCLSACCRDLSGVSVAIGEYTVNEPHDQILKLIMAEKADLIALSCYIWNIEKSLRIISDIKKIAPETRIVLGGPEASFGVFELMHANPAIDCVVKGEGEDVFRRLVEALSIAPSSPLPAAVLEGIENLFFRDGDDIIAGPHSSRHLTLDSIPSPFQAGLVNLTRPLTYYETSRGCPFSCAFCLSSVEGQVRSFSPERIESDLLFLMQQRVPKIKLVDRTFNYDAQRANEIWRLILANNRGSHFHFEIAADLLSDDNIELLKQVPQHTFRFEIGIQSASQETLQQVNRTADLGRIFYVIRRLRAETEIELHLDLVAGLPGENLEGFLASLQCVAGLHPHEIQVEPLKVLKGSPMREIAYRQDYHFSAFPPYTILRNPWLSFDDISRIETIGRLLDLFYNQGGFGTALRLMLKKHDFARLFDMMAQQAGIENLSGRTTRRRYELFAGLAEALLEKADQHQLHDALFFDYCSSEMPQMGKLPEFVASSQDNCAWPGRADLPEGLDLPHGSRVKAFRYRFERDYRDREWRDVPSEITFVYASGEGQGLRVVVV
jgi:anaerobic magnesium-protoporphyrin IX monomethyl ester cyclase